MPHFMKSTFFCLCSFAFLFSSTNLKAQSAVVKQAIVYSTLSIIAPEEEDPQGREGVGGFRNMMDGETKMTTYTKNDLAKTVIKSDFINSAIYRDNSKNLSTTIMEVMGQKMGFYADDQEMAKMQKMRDSMMNARRGGVSAENQPNKEPETEISESGETQKIAGFNCKKAYLITKRAFGHKDTAIIWFTPEIKLSSNISFASGNSMGMIPGLENAMKKIEKIEGLVTSFEMTINRGRKLKLDVNKIDLKTPIDDKEFQLPKNVEIKPMSEMRRMFGGMFRRNDL